MKTQRQHLFSSPSLAPTRTYKNLVCFQEADIYPELHLQSSGLMKQILDLKLDHF